MIYRPDLYKLQTRKSLKGSILQGLKYELMLKLLEILEICYIIQRLNSHNLLTAKVAEKVP